MSRPWHFTFDDAVRDSNDLTSNERLLLYVLRTYANGRTGYVERRFAPSLTTLARGTSMGRSTVARVLNAVEEKGWIVRSTPTTKSAIERNATNAYMLRVPSALSARPSPVPEPGVVPQRDGGSPAPGHRTDQTHQSHSAHQRMGSTHAPTAADPTALVAFAGLLGTDDLEQASDVWHLMLDEGIRHPDRFAMAKDAAEFDGYLRAREWDA